MNEVVIPQGTDDLMKKSLGAQFPPYVNLLNAKSPKVDGPEGEKYKHLINEFVLIEGEKPLKHLGKDEFDAVIVEFRMKAIRWNDKNVDNAYWPGLVESGDNQELYEEIQAQERNNDKIFRQHGPEFLLWIPSIERLATFHFGSWSARKYGGSHAYDLVKEGKNQVTFFRHYHDKGNYPRYVPCAKEMEGSISVFPNEDELKEAIRLFKNPPAQQKEETAPAER